MASESTASMAREGAVEEAEASTVLMRKRAVALPVSPASLTSATGEDGLALAAAPVAVSNNGRWTSQTIVEDMPLPLGMLAVEAPAMLLATATATLCRAATPGGRTWPTGWVKSAFDSMTLQLMPVRMPQLKLLGLVSR